MAAVFAAPQSHETHLQHQDARAAQSAMASTSTSTSDFNNNEHEHLLIDLVVGIPPQHVRARASFYSADTVVFADSAAPGFDPSASTSFTQGLRDGQVTIDGQQFIGNVSTDRIEVDGVVLHDASFVESKAGPSDTGAYFGLGYRSFVGPDDLSLVHRLSAMWEKPYYGLYLRPEGYHSSIEDSWRRRNPQQGSVSFGQPDAEYAKGSVHWLESDSRPDGAWSVPFDGISIDHKVVPMKTYPEAPQAEAYDSRSLRTVSIRSGPKTSILISQTSRKYVLPDAMVDSLMDEVPGAVKWIYSNENETSNHNYTIWEVPCDARNRIALTLGRRNFVLRPGDWTFTTHERCFSEFAYMSENGPPQIGTRFLGAYYTLWNLDPPEVGIMRLNRDLPAAREVNPPEEATAGGGGELNLVGPVASLGIVKATLPYSKYRRHSTDSYVLLVIGISLSVYCVYRLWRRRKIPLSPRSPRYTPLSKEIPV